MTTPMVVATGVVVTERPQTVASAGLGALERDAIVLTAEERRWGRRRVRTVRGREVVLALATGTVLQPGEVLHVADGWYLAVEAAKEALLALRPRTQEEALRVAFEVGNRHFTLALDGGRLLVPDDPAMVQLLGRLGVVFERTRAVFTPLGPGHRHD